MSVALPPIDRVAADITALLHRHRLFRESIKVDDCYGFQHCKSAFCIRCISRRVWAERNHLEQALPALLELDPSYQLWFVTTAVADSADVRQSAKAAVLGVRRMLDHPKLRDRVVGSFNVLEIAHKTSRIDPCAHVHSLLVTKPLDKGRYRISESGWVELWEECCPLARKRDPTVKLTRYDSRRPKLNLSAVATMIPRQRDHIARVIGYCCKWANPQRIADDYRVLLRRPEQFFQRIKALKGVTRFFGSLHLNPRNPTPAFG